MSIFEAYQTYDDENQKRVDEPTFYPLLRLLKRAKQNIKLAEHQNFTNNDQLKKVYIDLIHESLIDCKQLGIDVENGLKEKFTEELQPEWYYITYNEAVEVPWSHVLDFIFEHCTHLELDVSHAYDSDLDQDRKKKHSEYLFKSFIGHRVSNWKQEKQYKYDCLFEQYEITQEVKDYFYSDMDLSEIAMKSDYFFSFHFFNDKILKCFSITTECAVAFNLNEDEVERFKSKSIILSREL